MDNEKTWTIEDGIKCVRCGASVVYHRRDDGNTFVRVPITPEDSITDDNVTSYESDGWSRWECKANEDHALPDEMIEYLNGNFLNDVEALL